MATSDTVHDTCHAMHIMYCPACHKPNTAQNAKLQRTNLGIKIKCATCCIRSPSKDWKCNCGCLWHTCKRHAMKAVSNTAGGNNLTIVARKASKRPLLSASYEQLLDDDLKRESHKARKQPCDAIIDLGSASQDKARMLSLIPAKLRGRFHLATNSNSSSK